MEELIEFLLAGKTITSKQSARPDEIGAPLQRHACRRDVVADIHIFLAGFS
jgi:hypothetical protein